MKKFAKFLSVAALSMSLFAGQSVSAQETTDIIVYSPHGIELLTEIKNKFEAENEGINVIIQDIGGAEALQRIIAEAQNPQANILYGGPTSYFYNLKNQDLLVPYEVAWAENVDASYIGEDNAFAVPMVSPTTFGINTESGVEMPTSWLELADEKYNDSIITASAGSAATSTSLAVIASKFDAEGTLDTEGKAWFEAFNENVIERPAGDIQKDKIMNNTDGAAVSLFVIPTWENYIAEGGPLEYSLTPEEGIIEIQDAAAIIAGTEQDEAKLAASQAFMDFIGSYDTQLFLADTFNRVPTDPQARQDTSKEWMSQEYEVFPVDWIELTDNYDEYMDKIYNEWF
ncbi:extracellular solute-binding protein [Fundicoccus culcitae]|uniref:ABC transporter substrate-binding protein n=1 Tax=Fundicoccus culcitae TaxID=2969821 RepID=A0ABY5P450_9LACT|nr:extracellular solute-binding protein [Fundicoccus culcitae]UUX33385.1 ABC transporter substrate-binding protein [Fundicoccus culcitae]